MEIDITTPEKPLQTNSWKDFLTQNDLLTLFGSEEKLNYYLKLRDQSFPLEVYCDPTDSTKLECSRQWKPEVLILDVNEIITVSDQSNFSSKQTCLKEGNDNEDIKTEKSVGSSFACGVQGCSLVFSSVAEYESHYKRSHTYICSQCSRKLVSSFLLDIHLQENHDSYFQILSSRINMYRCLVESCEEKFPSGDDRRDHMVSIHKYPANFSFHQPLKQNLKSQNRKSEESVSMEVEENVSPEHPSHVDKTIKQPFKPKQNIIPRQICFGRGSARAFNRGRGGHWHRSGVKGQKTKVDIESVDMKELETALCES